MDAEEDFEVVGQAPDGDEGRARRDCDGRDDAQ